MNIIDKLLVKLSEESTWRGIMALAAVLGYAIDPARADLYTAAALTVIGLINVIKRQPGTK